MTKQSAAGRRRLDERLQPIAPILRDQRRPHRGWIRAVRDALGMSGPELAARMGVSQSTVSDLEASEAADRIQLSTLRRAADALGCDLVYVLVPRTGLEEAVAARARAKAAAHLGRVAHSSRLEAQEVGADAHDRQLDELAAQLADRRGLWSPPPG